MGTNYSFLLQIWCKNGCCGSLQHNSCKCVRDRVLRVAKRNNVKKSVKIIWRLEKMRYICGKKSK